MLARATKCALLHVKSAVQADIGPCCCILQMLSRTRTLVLACMSARAQSSPFLLHQVQVSGSSYGAQSN